MVHEDNRRVIHDWANGNYKSLKTVFVKESIAIGDHYHRNKEEVFFLAKGKFLEMVLGGEVSYNIESPFVVKVPPNTYHKFVCEKGSIIFGGASELYDPNDEIRE